MKRGRNIVLAEIAYSPETQMKIGLDMHIEYVFDKLLQGWLETGGVSLLQPTGSRISFRGAGR